MTHGTVLDRYGRLDGAFNNVGAATAIGPVTELDAGAWRADIALNLDSVFFGLKHQLPALYATGGGAIVNNASNLGVTGAPGMASYSAAKHGVVGLTRSAALDAATTGVRVNALITGGVDTPLLRRNMGVPPEEALRVAGAMHPIGRVAEADEIAAFVLFLLSDEARFITGARCTLRSVVRARLRPWRPRGTVVPPTPRGTMNAGTANKIADRRATPLWARWNGELDTRYTLGVEEEVMLLDPEGWSLAQSGDEVLARLSEELRAHTSPETHAAVLELTTGVQPDIEGVLAELGSLRLRLAEELDALGLATAALGTHPLTIPSETEVSAAPRYRVLEASLRMLAHREPTMALHVHVGVPAPEDAVRVLNGLRRNLALLLALSANSPFLRGQDSGFASARTVVFQAFPRTGPPRRFADYADYVGAVDALIASTAIPDPSFIWWDARLQPALGTVEVRVMDTQAELEDVAPLVALIQSLARLELEGEPSQATPSPEVLAENRFLAARDGMDARLIDAGGRGLVPARDMLEALVGECLPHAYALGCVGALQRTFRLADRSGADRQRQIAAGPGTLAGVVPVLADRFRAPANDWPTVQRQIVRQWTP